MGEVNDLMEDEAERQRSVFPGALSLGQPAQPMQAPPAARMPPTPTTPSTPVGEGGAHAFTFGAPAAFDMSRAPGLLNPEFCHPAHLAEFKREVPHLVASGKGDSFLLSINISTLLKMESNYLKRVSQEKGRAVEDILAKNQEAIANNPIAVAAGFDDRSGALHPARFLPGPICTAQELWLQARRVWGTSGYPPVAAYDLASVGLAGHITAKGFAALQDPSSAALSIRLFDVHNVTNKVEASKRLTLSASDDSMEVGESLKEATTLFAFQQSLRAVRELARFTMPWNHSFAALEGFLVNSNFLSRDLGNHSAYAVGVLGRFCDYVFALNAARWRASQQFLDITELGPTWSNWLASRGGPLTHAARAASQSGGAASGGGSGQQKGAKAAKPKQKAPASSSGPQAAARAVSIPMDDICQRFNKNKCPNMATGNCTTAAGLALRHVCNYQTTPTTKCLQPHPRILNH